MKSTVEVKDGECCLCGNLFSRESKILHCTECKKIYHYKCAAYSVTEVQELLERNGWICKSCLIARLKKVEESSWTGFVKKAAVGAGLTAVCLGGIPLVVGALGFGAAGVSAGSLAAAYQSAYLGGTIASGSVFATLQSIGAAGLAASAKVGIASVCTAVPFLRDLNKKKS